jgi:hypothetical protein
MSAGIASEPLEQLSTAPTFRQDPTMAPTWSHVYVTAHGHQTTGHFAGETAQIGFRWTITPTTSPSPVFSMPSYAQSSEAYADSSDANFTGTANWTARAISGPGGAEWFDIDPAVQLDMANDFRAYLGSISARQSIQFSWTHVKLALVANDRIPKIPPLVGTRGYVIYPSSVYTLKTPIVGAINGATGKALPPEVAICGSVRTNVVGRRGRGRMYIPALTDNALNTDGTVGGATASTITGATKTLVDSLANLPGGDPIAFNEGMVITSAGAPTGVWPHEARVGNHFDVHRSRQLDVVETYTSVAL